MAGTTKATYHLHERDTIGQALGDARGRELVLGSASGVIGIKPEGGGTQYIPIVKDTVPTTGQSPYVGLTGNFLMTKGAQKVETMAELAALVAGSTPYVSVGGYYADGDGGGGKFYWDTSNTASAVPGMIVYPNTPDGTKAWKRIYSGPVNVKWFGAKGDNDNDTTAIANALGSGTAEGVLTVYFPEGVYRTDSIEWPTTYRTILTGAGAAAQGGTIFKPLNTDGTAFIHVGAQDRDSFIPTMIGFKINGTATCGHGIHMETPGIGPNIEDVWIDDVTGTGKSAIILESTYIGTLKNVKLHDSYNGLTLNRAKGIVAYGDNWIAGCTNLGLNMIETAGTTQGNFLYFMEIGLGVIDATKRAIYCESSNNTIHISFYENYSNAQSIHFTSTARNNKLLIDNATTTQYRDDGYNNSLPMGFQITEQSQSGSNGFVGAGIGNGPITNLWENSSYTVETSSGFNVIAATEEDGTITTSAASAVILGSGTDFETAEDIVAGGRVYWTNDSAATIWGTVLTVDSATQLTLTAVAGSVATAVKIYSTGAPIRSIDTGEGYLDGKSLELDWGTIRPASGAQCGVKTIQEFSVVDGQTIHVMMMVKSSRVFTSTEYMQLRIMSASDSSTRAAGMFSNVYADRWTPMVIMYKCTTTEDVFVQIDMITGGDHAALVTNHDDFLFTVNCRYPTLVFNQNESSSSTHSDGLYIPRFVTQNGKAKFGTTEVPLLGGRIGSLATPINTSSTSEEDMFTLTITEGSIITDYQGIKFTIFGRTLATANTKQIKVYFDGTAFLDTTAIAANNIDWHIEGMILRRSGVLAQAWGFGDFNNALLTSVRTGLTSIDWNSDIIFKVTGQSDSATTGEITLDGVLVEAIQ